MDARKASERVVEEIEGQGKLASPDLKRLFTGGHGLTPVDKAVRDELFPIVFDLCGRSYAQLKRKTGMHRSTAMRLLENHRKAVEEAPDGPAQELSTHAKLEEVRFQGRKQLIELCFDGAQKALTHGIAQVGSMKGLEAIKAGAILTDKGLLLAGQPTSRVARTDEKMLTDDELAERLKKYQDRAFQLIPGGKSEAESA